MKEKLNIEKEWKLEIRYVDGTMLVIPGFQLDKKYKSLSHMITKFKKESGFFIVDCPIGDYHININNITYMVFSHSYERRE